MTASNLKPEAAGRVGAPFGVRGWVHFQSFLEPPETLFDIERLWIRRRDEWVPLELVEARDHGRGFVVRLDGVEDRDAAVLLRGADIGVLRDDLPAPEEDEYYWQDLVGLSVQTGDGVPLGTVGGFLETGFHDVMVLSGERERLVPFVIGTVVTEVDRKRGLIVVDWHPDD